MPRGEPQGVRVVNPVCSFVVSAREANHLIALVWDYCFCSIAIPGIQTGMQLVTSNLPQPAQRSVSDVHRQCSDRRNPEVSCGFHSLR
ncbi:hypothetical protein XENTR_v10021909 [Xenopus tropicalis]|nr:hypothetical protein XENTR_v10021909 [Xenopus tropicalis]